MGNGRRGFQARFKGPYRLRLRRALPSLSIRAKVAGALMLMSVVAISSFAAVSFGCQERLIQKVLRWHAEVLARQLADSGRFALERGDGRSLQAAVKSLLDLPTVAYATVLDARSRVLAHSAKDGGGPDLSASASPRSPADAHLVLRRSRRAGAWALDAAIPIVSASPAPAGRIGTAHVGLFEGPFEQAIRTQRRITLALTGLFLLLSSLASFPLARLLTGRLGALTQGLQRLAEGGRAEPVAVTGRDEVARLAAAFNRMLASLREKLLMEKYLSSATLQVIRAAKGDRAPRLGGEKRQVAVLFSDIRGFTALSEELPAETVVETLNIYLNLQAEVVYKRGGAVDKFVGDMVMAVFLGDDAEFRAALAAQEIQNFVGSLNETRSRAGKRILKVGIGLNCGEVILGNMGSERQMDYTAIGDPINVASRLCQIAAPGQVLMTWPALSAIAGRCRWKWLEPMALRGKRGPIEVFELADVPGAARRHMRRQVDRPAAASLAENGMTYSIRIKDLSQEGCAIEIPVPLESGRAVRLELAMDFLRGSLSAVVRHRKVREGFYRLGLSFTALPEEHRHAITEWVHHVETETSAGANAA